LTSGSTAVVGRATVALADGSSPKGTEIDLF
jgi:hypothetical protein